MEDIPIFIHLARDLSGPGSIIDKAVVHLPFISVLIPEKDEWISTFSYKKTRVINE